MRALEIDAGGRTVWAETGLTAGEYTAAAAAHGLATGFGDTGSVGIGGLTLGGGVGYLVRKHGLTIDNLLAAEIVTADGELRRVDADTDPDLFWAIRGGGGNFGVATRFQFRLHPVDTVVGGMLILPATPETIAASSPRPRPRPEELSTIANVMPAPPMPFMPEEHHGQLVVMAMLVHAGRSRPASGPSRRSAHSAAARRHAAADALPRDVSWPRRTPATARRGRRARSSSTRSTRAAETILDTSRPRPRRWPPPSCACSAARWPACPPTRPRSRTATRRVMRQRRRRVYDDPARTPAHEAWVDGSPRRCARTTRAPTSTSSPTRARRGSARRIPGATWERLARGQASVRPDNLFRLNQNIPPADEREVSAVMASATREVEELLVRIGNLVRRRDFLRAIGIAPRELETFDVEIERLRWRLAGAARASAVEDGEAA